MDIASSAWGKKLTFKTSGTNNTYFYFVDSTGTRITVTMDSNANNGINNGGYSWISSSLVNGYVIIPNNAAKIIIDRSSSGIGNRLCLMGIEEP